MNDETFRFLNDNDRNHLLARAEHLTRPRGEVLLRQGVHQRKLFLIRQGYVRVEQEDHGQGIAVARLGPGEVFGEMNFLEDTGATASVIADEDVALDVIAGEDVEALLASDPGFSARFFQSLAVTMARRLRHATRAQRAALAQQAERGRVNRDPVGQVTERQIPPDLTRAVNQFKQDLGALEKELRDERVTAEAAQVRVNGACDALCAAHYEAQAALLAIAYDDVLAFRDPSQLAQGLGGYVSRETFPYLMASATMARLYAKPSGYPEDRETLERIQRNEPEGDGRLGPLLDRWFLSRPVCAARRGDRQQVAELLKQVAASAGRGPVRVTSLKCGTAGELFDLVGGAAPVYATCIDDDPQALRLASEAARERGGADRITFLRADVMDLTRGPGRVSLGPQHLIYALGLSKYLRDEQLPPLLDWVHAHLADGGTAALTGLDLAPADQAFLEHVLEWRVRSRSEERLRELAAESRFRDPPPTIRRDGAGLLLLARRSPG